MPPKALQAPPPSLLPPPPSPQLQPSLPLALLPPVPRPCVPSPPSHGFLGTLSAQPPQALLEDDEELVPAAPQTPPLSQVHTFLQSLQARPPVQPPPALPRPQLPPALHPQAVTAPGPAPAQTHASGHAHTRPPFPHAAAQQQRGGALQQSPRSRADSFSAGDASCGPVGFTLQSNRMSSHFHFLFFRLSAAGSVSPDDSFSSVVSVPAAGPRLAPPDQEARE